MIVLGIEKRIRSFERLTFYYRKAILKSVRINCMSVVMIKIRISLMKSIYNKNIWIANIIFNS